MTWYRLSLKKSFNISEIIFKNEFFLSVTKNHSFYKLGSNHLIGMYFIEKVDVHKDINGGCVFSLCYNETLGELNRQDFY